MNKTLSYETWVEIVEKYTMQELFKEILTEERDPTWPSVNRQLRIRALHEVFGNRMINNGFDWVI